MKNHVRSRTYDDMVEVKLLEANSMYVNVRRKDENKTFDCVTGA